MKKGYFIKISILALGFTLLSLPASALDYPHTFWNSYYIDCGSCHLTHGSFPWDDGVQSNIDDTYNNVLCAQCHDGTPATDLLTHSSLNVDNSYGDWTIECTTCHDPHEHFQLTTYLSESYIESGAASTNIVPGSPNSTFTDTSKSFADFGETTDPSGYRYYYILVPDTTDNYYNYKILSNTSDTITVEGTLDTADIGQPYAIIYGRLVRSTINAPDKDTCYVDDILNEYICLSTTPKTVKFFDKTGANSFADGDVTYDGVCEVCHADTTYHRNDNIGFTHNATLNCTDCHKHLTGFEIDPVTMDAGQQCTFCHGFPPVDGTTLVGLNPAPPSDTGSTTAGRHNTHVNTLGIGCGYCHIGSVGSGATHNNGNTVTLGFYTFTGNQQGGTYKGQTGVTYNATATSPVTDVSTQDDTRTCSSVYCHSNVQDSTGTGPPDVYGSPFWDENATVQCGDCHKADGSGDGSYMDSGSHTKHVQSFDCSRCHDGAGSGTLKHVDNNIDVIFDPSLNPSGAYSQSTNVPGDGPGTCSTLFCHDAGATTPTPTWNGSLTGGCADCHGFPPTTNAHATHVQNSTLLTQEYGNTEVVSDATNYAFGCGNCHPTNKSFHANGTTDISLDPAEGGTLKSLNSAGANRTGSGAASVCNQIYCHSDGSGNVASAVSPQWDGNFTGDLCANCHSNSPSTGSHSAHVVGIHYNNIYTGTTGLESESGAVGSGAGHGDPNTSTTINCNLCHNSTLTVSRNDNNTVCNTCHNGEGNDIVSSNLVKSFHVSGAKDITFASITVRSKAQVRDDITTVTELNSNWTRGSFGYKTDSNSHDESQPAKALNNSSYTSGSCSNVVCHNSHSVTWGDTSVSCNTCHTALP